jgi:hypothetical protein
MLIYAINLMVIFLVLSWLIALGWPTARRTLRAWRRGPVLLAPDWFRVSPTGDRREHDEHETHAIGGDNDGGNPHGRTPDAP